MSRNRESRTRAAVRVGVRLAAALLGDEVRGAVKRRVEQLVEGAREEPVKPTRPSDDATRGH